MKLTVEQALRKAATLQKGGQRESAENIYRQILQRFPDNRRAADALRGLHAAGERARPSHAISELLGLYNQKRFAELIEQAAHLSGTHPDAPIVLSIEGAAHAALGRFDLALGCYDEALRLKPDFGDAHNSRGIALKQLGRLDEALASYDRALGFAPRLFHAHINRANLLQKLDRFDEALASYDRAIAITADFPDVYINRAAVLKELGRHRDALSSCDTALKLKPNLAEAYNVRGIILKSLGKVGEAIEDFDQALKLNAGFVDAHINRGNALAQLKRLQEALEEYGQALQLQPHSGKCHSNRGNVLMELGRPDEALADYDKALEFDPQSADAHVNRGNVLAELRRFDEAIASYEAALRIFPGHASAPGLLLYQKALICDWTESSAFIELPKLGTTGGGISPFTMLGLEDNAATQLKRAQTWTQGQFPVSRPPLPRPLARPSRLRLGYFSADYKDHPLMQLTARLFEVHDRSRFELHAFSYGPRQHDAMRKRASAAFDRFHDVTDISDPAVAQFARDLGIDIAIDLGGFTKGSRTGIFAHRAAPLQINYLGFPGTMGADFIDYIIADHTLIPPESTPFYSEKVIYLPDSYMVNDDLRRISDRNFTRAELDLPEDGFVFCCFNNTYKITPAEFDIWMRLLGKVPDSVLWLLETNRWVKANLHKEARARGIDPGRLVFAPRMALPDHLARHQCADLFLDTFIYNAHTTGSDALWAGLPIVTKAGDSFAARVGASLLNAVGLGELVTHCEADYEKLALGLALDRERLRTLRDKLADNRLTKTLFRPEIFARDIEWAYDLAFDRAISGTAPEHIVIDDGPHRRIPAR